MALFLSFEKKKFSSFWCVCVSVCVCVSRQKLSQLSYLAEHDYADIVIYIRKQGQSY